MRELDIIILLYYVHRYYYISHAYIYIYIEMIKNGSFFLRTCMRHISNELQSVWDTLANLKIADNTIIWWTPRRITGTGCRTWTTNIRTTSTCTLVVVTYYMCTYSAKTAITIPNCLTLKTFTLHYHACL